MIMRSIGIRVKDFRMKKDETLKDVHVGTGLSISYLSDIETNRTTPSLETCQKLANYYNTTLSNFLLGVELSVESGLSTKEKEG